MRKTTTKNLEDHRFTEVIYLKKKKKYIYIEDDRFTEAIDCGTSGAKTTEFRGKLRSLIISLKSK